MPSKLVLPGPIYRSSKTGSLPASHTQVMKRVAAGLLVAILLTIHSMYRNYLESSTSFGRLAQDRTLVLTYRVVRPNGRMEV